MHRKLIDRGEVWNEGAVVLVRWHDSPSVDAVETLNVFLESIGAEHGPLSFMAFISGFPRVPDAETRNTLASAMRRLPFSKIAIVYEEVGFVASAIRSVTTALALLSGDAVPQRMFGKRADAIDWLAEENAQVPPAMRRLLSQAEIE